MHFFYRRIGFIFAITCLLLVSCSQSATPVLNTTAPTYPPSTQTPSPAPTETATPTEEFKGAEDVIPFIQAFFEDFSAGRYSDTTGPEYFRKNSSATTNLGIDYFHIIKVDFPNDKFGIEYSESGRATPAILGVYSDTEKVYVALGAEDVAGRPFVWVGVVGLVDKEKYPNLSKLAFLATTQDNELLSPMGTCCPSRDVYILHQFLPEIQGLPVVIAQLDALVWIEESPPSAQELAEAGLRNEEEIKILLELNAYDFVKPLYDVYAGSNVTPEYVFREGDDLIRLLSLENAPYISQIHIRTPRRTE